MGSAHTCAILDDDSLKCWGYNEDGQLGLGDTNPRGGNAGEMEDNLPAVALGMGRTARTVAVGSAHTCAILDNDSIKCWGSNSNGRLGLAGAGSKGDEAGEMGDNLSAVNLLEPSPPSRHSVSEWAIRLGYISSLNPNCLSGGSDSKKANVILIMVDDAEYFDFGIYRESQNPYWVSTPWIDSIAHNGVRFSNAYAAAHICSPSRASIITSRPHWQNGVLGNVSSKPDSLVMGLPQSEKTVAEYMKEEGYSTAFFGKWHLGDKKEFHAITQGFDKYWLLKHAQGPYFPPYDGLSINTRSRLEEIDHPFYLTDRIALETLDYMSKQQKRDPEAPFYITISFTAPHGPSQAKSSDIAKLKHIEDIRRQKYFAMIMALDDAVGVILSYLNSTGLCNDTLLFFINDNGNSVRRYGLEIFSGKKETFYEGGIRVPFMMQWPGKISKGLVYDHMVSGYDILPTSFLGAAKGEFNPDDDPPIVGKNLLPNLSSGEKTHECLFWGSEEEGAVRCGKWKLLWREGASPELYDLEKDIGEKHNLLEGAKEEDQNKADELRVLFDEWAEKWAGG